MAGSSRVALPLGILAVLLTAILGLVGTIAVERLVGGAGVAPEVGRIGARAPLPAEAPIAAPASPSEPRRDGSGDETPGQALGATARAALLEESPYGPVPRMGPNGEASWRAYARPFSRADTRPRVALVVTGLGLSSERTQAAIHGLPPAVTLAFQPYAEDLPGWVTLARDAGHEVMLDLPMEPVDFPDSDPGPRALSTQLDRDENLDRLLWILSRASGYVGVVEFMGSRFSASRGALEPVIADLARRGLMIVDTRASATSQTAAVARSAGMPFAVNDLFLDRGELSRSILDDRLRQLETLARERGAALGVAQALPLSIERIGIWASELAARGIALAPVSAMAVTPEPRKP